MNLARRSLLGLALGLPLALAGFQRVATRERKPRPREPQPWTEAYGPMETIELECPSTTVKGDLVTVHTGLVGIALHPIEWHGENVWRVLIHGQARVRGVPVFFSGYNLAPDDCLPS